MKTPRAILRALPAALTLATPALAVTGTWTATTAGPFTYETTGNWSNGIVANAMDDTANLTVNITASQTINLTTAVTLGTLNLNDSTTAGQRYTLADSGGSLTMQVSTGSAAINFQNTVNTSGHVISSGLSLASNTIVTNSTAINSTLASNASITGVISGSGSLTLTGPSTGWIFVSGANTYSGGTTLSGGTGILFNSDASFGQANQPITIGTGGAALLGSATNATMGAGRTITINSGAILSLQSASFGGNAVNPYTIAANITGSGGLSKAGSSSAAILSGSNDYSGGTSVAGNALRAGSSTAFSPNSVVSFTSGGRLQLNGFNNSVAGLSGSAGVVENNNTLSPTPGNATLTINTPAATSNAYSSNLQDGTGGGTLAIIKSGTGAQAITSGTFTGGLTLNAGTWQIGGVNGIGNGPVVINGGAISSNGTNARTLTNTANTLALNAGFTLGDATNNGALTLPGALNSGSNSLSLNILGANLHTLSGALTGSGTLTKSGAGLVVFSGSNAATFSGAWSATAGKLGFATDSSLGAPTVGVALDGGSFFYTTTGQTFPTTRSLVLGSAGGTLDGSTGHSYTIAAVISGSGSLTKVSGATYTLSGNNTYTGGTTISAGTLIAGSNTAFGGTSGGITLSTGATLDLNGFSIANAVTNNGGTIVGAAGNATITQTGGTLSGSIGGIITASGSIAGTPTITGTLKGTATFTGAVTIGATGIHAPGNSPGIETFSAGITYVNGSTLEWEFSGDTLDSRGGNYDGVNVTGGDLTIISGAKLKVINFSAITYAATDWDSVRNFSIVDASLGTTSGDFTLDPTGDTTIPGQGTWSVATTSGLGGDTILTWTPVPEPSTYAALAGLLALGLALRRRRM